MKMMGIIVEMGKNSESLIFMEISNAKAEATERTDTTRRGLQHTHMHAHTCMHAHTHTNTPSSQPLTWL